MSEECWKRIYCTGSDSAQNSMEYWDYTMELECLKGQDDLQLAAEIGKKLLERNRELENVIKVQQSTIDDQCLQLEHLSKQANDARELLEARLRTCEQLELTAAELERTNQKLRKELREEKQRSRSLSETVSSFESPTDEFDAKGPTESPRFTPPPVMRRRKSEPPWKLIRQLRYERQISKEFKCVSTMTEDLFDDERNKLEILEASFLRELDRRLEKSEAEIERLQEEISTLLIQLAESEGRARDEAEHSAELEAKINELTKLLTILTTPPDPRRIDERIRPNFGQSHELSLEEEFRLSGDFDDVSSGIQSDIDSSLTTRDVSPDIEERKVVTGQSTTNNSTDFSQTDHFSTTQGTEEEESLLLPSSSSAGLSSHQCSGEASCVNWELKGEGKLVEECHEIQVAESSIPKMRSRGVELSYHVFSDSQKGKEIPSSKDYIKSLTHPGRNDKAKSTNVKKNEEGSSSSRSAELQIKKEQNNVDISEDLEKYDTILQQNMDRSAILNTSVPIKPDELSETSSNYAQNEPCEVQPCSSKKKGKRRRKRVCNGGFPSKPVEKVPKIEAIRETEPIQETSALTKPIKELLSVCKVVGTFAFCYMVNAYFEISGQSQNPISELAPPLFVVNDSVTFVGN